MKLLKTLTFALLIGFIIGIAWHIYNDNFLKPDYGLELGVEVITLTNNRTGKIYIIPADTENFGDAIQKAIEIDNL